MIDSNIDVSEYTIEKYFNDYKEYKIKYKTNENVKFVNEEINIKLIEKFIEKKEDIHINNERLLMINCIIGDINVVKLLMEHKANIKHMECLEHNITKHLLIVVVVDILI